MSTKTKSAYTPWGPSQWSETLAEGIAIHSTAGHGGIELSPERQKQLPKWLKTFESGFCAKPRWWEEDCEIGLIIIAFYDDLKDRFHKPKSYYVEQCRRWYAFIPESV